MSPEPVTASSAAEKTARVSRMFGRIARSYDFMNRLMSAGQDQSWRQLAADLAQPGPDGIALDVATGTGDLALALAQRTGRVVGADPCADMVTPGVTKIARSGYYPELRLYEPPHVCGAGSVVAATGG